MVESSNLRYLAHAVSQLQGSAELRHIFSENIPTLRAIGDNSGQRPRDRLAPGEASGSTILETLPTVRRARQVWAIPLGHH